MVKFNKGQLIQYVPYHGAAHTSKPQNQGRILDPIVDTTNTFTGAYVVCIYSIPSNSKFVLPRYLLLTASCIGSEWESYEANGAPRPRGGYYHVFGAVHDVISIYSLLMKIKYVF